MIRLLETTKPLTAALAVGAGLCVSGTALAGPGDHVALGPSTEMVPSLDVGLEYRSNITQSSSDPTGGINMALAPGVQISNETPDTEFELTGDWKLTKYFGRVLSNADRFNDFDVQLGGRFLKTRPVGFLFSNRTALVNNNADRLGNTPFHTRFRNNLQGGLEFRPGPVLQLYTKGNFEYDQYRVPPGAQAGDLRSFNNRLAGGVTFGGEWLFFPRTAVVLDGGYTRYSWDRNWIPEGANGTFLAMPDSSHFRLLGGIRGRFTERLVIAAQAGYGIAAYDEQSVINSCTGGAECDPTNAANLFGADLKGLERLLLSTELRYTFDEGRTWTLGYRKDFDDVFFTNYMAYNRVYTGLQSQFGPRFGTDVTLSLRQEAYRGEEQRSDVFIDARGNVSYAFQPWAKVVGGLGYQQRVSPSATDVSYNDVKGRLVLSLTY